MNLTRPAGAWARPWPSAAATETADRRMGDIERRVDDLDRKLDNRFMWLLAAFAAGFMALGGLILNRTDATNERLGAKIDAINEHLAAKIDGVDARLGGKIDGVSQRVSDLSERTARIETRTSPKP